MNYSVSKNEYLISTDKSKIDIEYVHAFLSQSYWSPGVPLQTVKKAMENSLCFGLYLDNKQIGYTRVITDTATFAYLADVFVDENYRGQGLGKWLIDTILSHPDLQGLRRIILTTKDAHKLYEHCGFISVPNPERYMVHNPARDKSK
jgi:GNAT superfamily N-acetyltransferase